MPHGPLLLLDTASLYYRAFYALPESMTAPDGHPHNAIRGLLGTMTRLVQDHRPRAVAACWDVDWRPQWRVDLLPTYKTHRLADEAGGDDEETPDTLGPQIDAIAGLLDALDIPRPGEPGYEADDIIASLAARETAPCLVVTGDRDLVQTVAPGVTTLLAVNGGMEKWPRLDAAAVGERFGVRPDQYVDLAVLRGDPSDGIPGVPGFGAKTATAVIEAYGTVEAAVEQARSGAVTRPLTPRLAGLLVEHADRIAAMKQAATARTDASVPSPHSLSKRTPNRAALDALCAEWGVGRFVRSLEDALDQTVDA